MRRIILLGILSIITIASSLDGFASGLTPRLCTIGNRPVYYPIVDIGFIFDEAISIVENSTATLYSDGKPLETGILSCSNHIGEKRTQGTAVVTFESPLLLPKGNTYRLVVPEGVITAKNNPDISNEEISVDFFVPATIGPATPTIEDGSIVEKTDGIGFYFGVETAPVENGKAKLLREGVPVREYDCDVSWDWDLGYAGIDFGEEINFENGVRYSIQLPEGCVSAMHRPDIVNEKAEVSFIGGYTEPVKPIQYVWCSLFNHHPTDVLGEVSFFYDQPIALSMNPLVQLYNNKENIIVKESVPIISEGNGKWILIADFENTPLTSGIGYSIIIPEGTLVSKSGDVVVNQRNVMAVGETNGIAGLKNTQINISVGHGAVTINQPAKQGDVKLLSLDGRIISSIKAPEENVRIQVPAVGTYLLYISGKAYKISVK